MPKDRSVLENIVVSAMLSCKSCLYPHVILLVVRNKSSFNAIIRNGYLMEDVTDQDRNGLYKRVEISFNGQLGAYFQGGFSMMPVSPYLKGYNGKTSIIHTGIANEDINVSWLDKYFPSYSAYSDVDDDFGSLTKSIYEQEMLKKMSEFGNQDDPFKATPLILFARTLKTEELLFILDKYIEFSNFNGFDKTILDRQDDDGRTVLHYAYALGFEDVVIKLKEAGAKEDVVDKNGQTPKELLINITEQEVNQILINLEMHPDRDIKASRNILISNTVKIFYISDERRPCVILQNKNLLQQIVSSAEFLTSNLFVGLDNNDNFIRDVKNIIIDAEKNLTGLTIGKSCWSGVLKMKENFKKIEHDSLDLPTNNSFADCFYSNGVRWIGTNVSTSSQRSLL